MEEGHMSDMLIVHIAAGSLAILAGAGALYVTKGAKAHRRFGIFFVLSMLLMAGLGFYLALFVPSTGRGAAPPQASAVIAVLTIYLVGTAWLTVRRQSSQVLNRLALLLSGGITAALILFGTQAALHSAKPGAFVPYFAFALFAAFAAMLDYRVVRAPKLPQPQRIARHLWRMCAALFFATSFFFIGQQKVMPVWLHGSPVLLVLAFAPLMVMAVWLTRIWASVKSVDAKTGVARSLFSLVGFRKKRSSACA
jgi:hypothetical protein